MTSRRARETSSDAVENDIIESTVLNNPYIVPEIASLAPLIYKSFRLKNGPKLAKFGNLTSKYDLLTLKMTSGATENDTIELSVLKNSDIDTEIVSLALLEVTLAQDSS